MAINAIEHEFRTSKMADGSHYVKDLKKNKNIRIDLKWPKMKSKVNFGHPKWPMAAILSKFPNKLKLGIDLKWPEMRSKVNFGQPIYFFDKMDAGGHFGWEDNDIWMSNTCVKFE